MFFQWRFCLFSDESFLEEMDDDDDESDEETFSKSNPKVWIKEDDDVLDFLDASASQKITSKVYFICHKANNWF